MAAIKLKKLRQNMGSAAADLATPLPKKNKDLKSRSAKNKIVGGLKGVRRIFLPKNGEVFFAAKVTSAEGGEGYAVKIKFLDWDGEKYKDRTPKTLRVETTSGTEMWIDKPNINRNGCQYSCTCADFRFNWEYPAFKNKTLLRKGEQQNAQQFSSMAKAFTSYDRETPPTGARPAGAKNPNPDGRDFKNPANVLGMCKHIYKLTRFLVDRDLIVGSF